MMRVALTRFYSHKILKGFKKLVYRDGVKITKWHLRYVFRSFANKLLSKKKLKNILQ